MALASELISESWCSLRLIEMLRHVIPFTHMYLHLSQVIFLYLRSYL